MEHAFFKKLWILLLFTACTSTLSLAWFLQPYQGSSGFAASIRTEFKCQTVGRFPDPYDCRNYYDCNSSGTYTRYRCGPRKRYSVNLQSCTFDSNVICYNQAFRCTTAGERGAWPGDARIFYVCEVSGTSGKLIPLLFKCPEGSSFSGKVCL